jgi:phage gpG-like protein
MADEIEGLDRLRLRIDQLVAAVEHPEHPLKASGAYLVGSVQKTIRVGGRPKAFTPLAKSTIAMRRKGKGSGGARILINNAHLLNSISSQPVSSGGGAGIAVGTNYGKLAKGGSIAEVLHFGGKGAYTIVAKNKKGLAFMGSGGQKIVRRRVTHPPLPARPFMVLQIPEDEIKVGSIFERHIARQS